MNNYLTRLSYPENKKNRYGKYVGLKWHTSQNLGDIYRLRGYTYLTNMGGWVSDLKWIEQL